MAALLADCRHSVFYPCGCYLLSSFSFLACSQPSQIGCLSYFDTWCGLSANLECRSEMCCMWLTEIQVAKLRKKSPSAHHHTTLSGYIFATTGKACINNRKNNFLNSNISSICPHNTYVERLPTNGWDPFVSFGHPRKFQQFLLLGFITAPSSLNGGQPNFAWCLAIFWAGTQYTIYTILGALAP